MSYQYPFIPGHSSMPATPQTTYRWDDGDPRQHQQQQEQQRERQDPEHQRLEQQILQHSLQHQPEQQPQDVFVPSAASTSAVQQLQERVPVVPSQNTTRRPGSGPTVEGDEPPPQRLQHVSVPALLQPEHMRPPMIDTRFAYHVGTSASPPSGPPSAGPSSAFSGVIGPVRARISPVHPDPRAIVHPYRRPQSAAGVPVIARSRREPEELQSVRPSISRRAPYSASTITTIPAAPLSAPATSTSMVPSVLPSNAKMTSTFKGLINPAYSASGVGSNFVIRTDLQFDSETSVLSALCELPGRSKSDVTVVLSTNPVNRVKQLVVTAKTPRGLGNGEYVLRERRSDSVSRTFVVPSETTPGDVTVAMRDGLLSLKIQFPPPKAVEDAQEISIC